MADSINLYVKTEELESAAAKLSDEISQFENNWKKLQDVVVSSKRYWEGDASNEHQSILQSNEQDLKSIIASLKRYPEDLLIMAGVYKETESTVEAVASALPTNVIL